MGIKNLWDFEFWHADDKHCPPCEAMGNLKTHDYELHEALMKKLHWMAEREIGQLFRLEFIKDMHTEGLLELLALSFRFLGVVEYGGDRKPKYICLHLFRKKTGKTPKRHIIIALE